MPKETTAFEERELERLIIKHIGDSIVEESKERIRKIFVDAMRYGVGVAFEHLRDFIIMCNEDGDCDTDVLINVNEYIEEVLQEC